LCLLCLTCLLPLVVNREHCPFQSQLPPFSHAKIIPYTHLDLERRANRLLIVSLFQLSIGCPTSSQRSKLSNYFTVAEMIAISIKEDWTPPPSSINCWAVKKGDLGWARGHANQSGWALVQILDANRMKKVVAGQSSCYIPERIITYGALQCSPKIQLQPTHLNSYEVPMFTASESYSQTHLQ
jgi:hypothetical protein